MIVQSREKFFKRNSTGVSGISLFEDGGKRHFYGDEFIRIDYN